MGNLQLRGKSDFVQINHIYRVEDFIGSGAYGKVFKAIEIQTEGTVAVKRIDKKNLTMHQRNRIWSEVETLKSFDHPSIVKFSNFYQDKSYFYIVTELVVGGDLYERCVAKKYREKQIQTLILNLLTAVKYIHDKNIIHRDIRPENILLERDSSDVDIKLCDFGFSGKCKYSFSRSTFCGTAYIMAPEIIDRKFYGKAVDMWSIGVTTFVLLSSHRPFSDEIRVLLLEKISRATYVFDRMHWHDISDDAKDFIQCLLIKKPSDRMTVPFRQVLFEIYDT